MARAIAHFAALLCLVQVSHAQDTSTDLRGTLAGEDPASQQRSLPAGTDTSGAVRRSVFLPPPFSAQSNAATAETGSTGLGRVGRIQPVQPFSDRIVAVSRISNGSDGGLDDSVFGGDTLFDASEGFRVGTFTIFPELTVSGGWTDNQSQSADGTSGQLYKISPNVTAASDWNRHQLDLALRGSFTGYPGSDDDDDPNLTASASLRLDISANTSATGDLSYTYSREDRSSAESANGASDIHTLAGTVAATREAGLLRLTGSAGAERTIYTDDDDVAIADTSARDNTLYTAGLRLESNGGGVLSPFAEVAGLIRRFDQTCSDAVCEDRASTGYELRGGAVVSAGPKIAGEVGVGWRVENLEDERLDPLSGLLVDASLVWSPSRLTTVTAGVGTNFATTDIDGASGSIIYAGDLRVAHGFSSRLVGEVGVGYSYRTYQGVSIDERTFSALGEVTYALTRNAALTAGYTFRDFDSSRSGSDYTENRVEAGIRFRH